jgi:omega-hydroxy-beta-dihydromenaquinone-9 sulfotransferase
MYFDARTFLRQKFYAARHGAGDGPYLLTAVQLVLYPLVHLGFALDELLHPEIATTPVERPVFIVSSPRSGSTLLHEWLAADPQTVCFSTRELIFPSPTVRRLLPAHLLAAADTVFRRRFAALEAIHPLRFEQPEEDELLFLLLGNSGISSYLFPYGPELDALAVNRFWQWPSWKRERFGRWYHRCVQRLLWTHGCDRYVGKSPHFLGKIDDLYRWYPAARFIYLVRSPYESVASALSMITTMWRLATQRPPSPAAIETIYRALLDLARYGDDVLRSLPDGMVTTVRYAALVADPRAFVESLYARFGWPVTEEYAERLARGALWHRGWRSRHRYAAEQFGITGSRIRADFAFLFDHYGLDDSASECTAERNAQSAVV